VLVPALKLATAAVSHSAYTQAVTSFLAARAGWSQSEVLALRDGRPLGEDKTDALVSVVREAATRSGQSGGLPASTSGPPPSW